MPYKNPEDRREYEKKRYQDPKRRANKNKYDQTYRDNHELKEYHKQYYLENKERMNSQTKEYYNNNKEHLLEKIWGWNTFRKYGLTTEEYNQLGEQQGWKCAICFSDKTGHKGNKWHIDHSHDTKKVRGLLCRQCNTGLGNFKDDLNRLENAIKYLKKSININI